MISVWQYVQHVGPGYKLMSACWGDIDQPCNPKFDQTLADTWGKHYRAQYPINLKEREPDETEEVQEDQTHIHSDL
jgi:hypothetical protein